MLTVAIVAYRYSEIAYTSSHVLESLTGGQKLLTLTYIYYKCLQVFRDVARLLKLARSAYMCSGIAYALLHLQ